MEKLALIELLQICNADPVAIAAVEMAYDIGYAAGLAAAAGRRDDE